MIPNDEVVSEYPEGMPRMCGDDPDNRPAYQQMLKYAPHVRG